MEVVYFFDCTCILDNGKYMMLYTRVVYKNCRTSYIGTGIVPHNKQTKNNTKTMSSKWLALVGAGMHTKDSASRGN